MAEYCPSEQSVGVREFGMGLSEFELNIWNWLTCFGSNSTGVAPCELGKYDCAIPGGGYALKLRRSSVWGEGKIG